MFKSSTTANTLFKLNPGWGAGGVCAAIHLIAVVILEAVPAVPGVAFPIVYVCRILL